MCACKTCGRLYGLAFGFFMFLNPTLIGNYDVLADDLGSTVPEQPLLHVARDDQRFLHAQSPTHVVERMRISMHITPPSEHSMTHSLAAAPAPRDTQHIKLEPMPTH